MLTSYTFASFSFEPSTGVVQLDVREGPLRSLRVCMADGAALFIVGSLEQPQFYKAHDIVRGLLLGADLMDGLLPPEVSTPRAIAELPVADGDLLICAAMGESRAGLIARAGSKDKLDAVIAQAASLGFIVSNARAVASVEVEVRAAMRDAAGESSSPRILGEPSETTFTPIAEVLPSSVANAPFLVPVPGGAELLERAERRARGTSSGDSSADRVKWPFKDMEIGDVVRIPSTLAKRAQTAVHVYAARVGKRFSSTTDRADGSLRVLRMHDRVKGQL